MSKAGDGITQPDAFLRDLSWLTSQCHSWCPDAYAGWAQVASSRWLPPTSSRGYDRQYRGGIEWCCEEAPKSKTLPDDEISIPKSEQRIQRRLSDSSDTLKSSEIVLLVCLPIKSKALVQMRMWLGYASTIRLWILPRQALRPIHTIQAAAQLQISDCEDGMHWLYGCSRICNVGGYFSGTLVGGRMGDNMEFFREVLGLFLVFCLFYYYIVGIHAWRAVLRVHHVGMNSWDVCSWERHSHSDRTPCMCIM